jgi:hypothetical protein
MFCVDNLKFAFGLALVEILGVDRWYNTVSCAVDYEHWRVDGGQKITQDRQLFRVGAHVTQ